MCVCYIKDEQKSLRPDADVAIWPFTLIGICVYGLHACACVCVSVSRRGVQKKMVCFQPVEQQTDFQRSYAICLNIF